MKVDGATDIDARSDATYRRRAMHPLIANLELRAAGRVNVSGLNVYKNQLPAVLIVTALSFVLYTLFYFTLLLLMTCQQ